MMMMMIYLYDKVQIKGRIITLMINDFDDQFWITRLFFLSEFTIWQFESCFLLGCMEDK